MISTAVSALMATFYLFVISKIYHFDKFTSADQSKSIAWRPPIIIYDLSQVIIDDILKFVFIFAWQLIFLEVAYIVVFYLLNFILFTEVSTILVHMLSLLVVVSHMSFAIEYRYKREKMKQFNLFGKS